MNNSAIAVLRKNPDRVLESWMELQGNDDLMGSEELLRQSQELLGSLLEGLNDESIDNPRSTSFDGVQDALAAISLSRARQGFSPRETGLYIFSLKHALLATLQRELPDATDLYRQSFKIVRLVDSFGVTTLEYFIQGREDVILRQTSEMDEISTPVIKVWDGILALPIIGTLDSSRTQTVMENLLVQIVETGSSIAILDISGVPMVDSLVAQHLMKTVSATRLMGAECIISGIRPEIAQTIVHLGIDLSGVVTRSTLASALKTAFSILQLSVIKR